MFDQEEFNDFIVANKVIRILEQPVTLASGATSYWYTNWRLVLSQTKTLEQTADYMLAFIDDKIPKEHQPDSIYGVPEGITPLAIIAQYIRALTDTKNRPIAMGRGTPKEHGNPNDKYFVAPPVGKTLVVEDVTTTGSSLVKSITTLQKQGIEVIAAIGLTNRMEHDVTSAVMQVKTPYFAMSKATDILPRAYQQMIKEGTTPSEKIVTMIEQEFRAKGTELKMR